MVEACHRARDTVEAKKDCPVLQALMNLSNTGLAQAQDQDKNRWLIKDKISERPKRPPWEHVQSGNAEVTNL